MKFREFGFQVGFEFVVVTIANVQLNPPSLVTIIRDFNVGIAHGLLQGLQVGAEIHLLILGVHVDTPLGNLISCHGVHHNAIFRDGPHVVGLVRGESWKRVGFKPSGHRRVSVSMRGVGAMAPINAQQQQGKKEEQKRQDDPHPRERGDIPARAILMGGVFVEVCGLWVCAAIYWIAA